MAEFVKLRTGQGHVLVNVDHVAQVKLAKNEVLVCVAGEEVALTLTEWERVKTSFPGAETDANVN